MSAELHASSSITESSQQQEPQLKHSIWLAFATIALTVCLVIMDGTIVNIAIPHIMTSLKLSFTSSEWIITIYSLFLASFLITFGRISDHIGRQKMMILGLITFGIGAIFSACSHDLALMLIGRCIQGLGGSMIMPTTIASINTLFKGKSRIMAFAMYGIAISVVVAIAPVIGGLFATYLTWRWIFWLDLIVAIIALIFAFLFLPNTYGEEIKGRFDFLGFIISVIAFSCIVFALTDGKNYGWWYAKDHTQAWWGLSRIVWIALCGILALIIFVWREIALENAGKSSLMSLEIFKYRSFTLGTIANCLGMIGEYGVVFLMPLYLENILGMSALKAGLVLCVMGAGAFVSGGFAEPLVRFTSTKTAVVLGAFLEAIALGGIFFTIRPDASEIKLIYLWLCLYGLGLGFANAQLSSVIMIDVPDTKAGQASSLKSTSNQLGSALGVAIIGTVLVSSLGTTLPAALQNMGLPQVAQHGIETAIIDSAGSAIGELKHSHDYLMMPHSYQIKFDNRINKGFTTAVADSIGVASLILCGQAIATCFLPSTKKKETSDNNVAEQ